MAFELDPALVTGHPTIDTQHRELISRIVQLLDAMKSGRGRSEISSVIQFLGDYVVEHFDTEESIMRARNYPEFQSHLVEHQTFESELAKIRADFNRDGPSTLLVLRVNKQLLDWLKNHIHVRDRALAGWLAENRPARTG